MFGKKNVVLKRFAEDVQEFIDMNLESLEELSNFKKQGKMPESVDNEDELNLRILDLQHSAEILKIMKNKYLNLKDWKTACEKAELHYSRINKDYNPEDWNY